MKHNPILVLDMDGTVVAHEYPDIGKDIGAVPYLKQLTDVGVKIILYTMRSHLKVTKYEKFKDVDRDCLQEAIDWFKNNDIPLFGVNENPEQKWWTESPKPHGDLCLDDRNLGTPLIFNPILGRHHVDWNTVGPQLLRWAGVSK